MYSSTKLTLNCSHNYFPIKILDLASFTDGPSNDLYSSEAYSGLWIVSKVARIIEDYKFKTNIVMCREAMNGARGG